MPVPNDTQGDLITAYNVHPIYSVYFMDTGDARYVPQELYYEQPTALAFANHAGDNWQAIGTSGGASETNDNTVTARLQLKAHADSADNSFIQFVLPTGTQVSANSVIANGADTITDYLVISSTSNSFKYPSLTAKVALDGGVD